MIETHGKKPNRPIIWLWFSHFVQMIALQNDLLNFYLVRIDFYWLWVSERTFICFWQFYGVWKSRERKKTMNSTELHMLCVFLDIQAPVVWPLHKDLIGIGKCEINKTKRCEPVFFLAWIACCFLEIHNAFFLLFHNHYVLAFVFFCVNTFK